MSRQSYDGDIRSVTRLVNRILSAFLGDVAGMISAILIGTTGGPAFSGRTSLYQFFGYLGSFCGSVLIMRVLVVIFSDGLN